LTRPQRESCLDSILTWEEKKINVTAKSRLVRGGQESLVCLSLLELKNGGEPFHVRLGLDPQSSKTLETG